MEQAYFLEGNSSLDGKLPFSFHIQQTFFGTCASAHVQEYIELLYCHKGRHQVMLNGIASEFNPGDLVVITPNTIHSVYCYGDEGSCYSVLKADLNLICSATGSASELQYLLPFRISGIPNQTHFSTDKLKGTSVPSLFDSIARECATREYGYEFALKIDMERLLLWVLRQWHKEEQTCLPKGKQAQKLNHILDYLWKNYDQKLQGTAVAARFYMSYSHLSNLIRSATGFSFVKYLNYIRITQAKKLLIGTERSITEIALDVGFCSTSYFIEQFRELEQLSPGQFRKQGNAF